MKSPFLNPCFAVCVLVLGALATVPQTSMGQAVPAPLHPPIVPLGPEELLRFLPAAPANWKLTESKASNLFMEWARSEAARGFTLVTPPPADGGASTTPAEPPQTTRVKIYDTGYFPAFSGDFDDFTPGKYGAGESLLIEGLPAHRIPLGTDGERLRVSVRRRFIVEIETHHQPPDAARKWLRAMDLAQLQHTPDTGAIKLPRPFVLTRLDELDPKNNTTAKAAWMTDEEFDANAKRSAPSKP